MNIALIQQDVVKADKVMNFRAVRRLVEMAMEDARRPDIIILPELWSTGYALEDLSTLARNNGNE
jgi:omega-amidase